MELDGSRRAAFLEQACGGDESLWREVESLLAEAQGTEDFLEAPAVDMAARDLTASCESDKHSHPSVIGHYRIIRVLGEGGMGTVYEAEQDQPRRIVALKVIKLGQTTPERLRRFKRESQALGRLQHPGIAQIYESNTTDTAFGPEPYFAMEFIRGLPLCQYAEARQLSTRQRLALTVKVSEAVHHAHQRGLIHRDLKPGNILVDETGQPKVLDFGVARITQAEADESVEPPTMQTGLGQLLGTLAYMSPEQVAGQPLEVDARSDVYSLGVILFELLSGRLPYQLSRHQLPEAVRTIRDDEPESLSSINRNSRGDIETIVRKALEKNKSRRYASAADLGADIQRYLNEEPIAARPPSTVYQLQKFARRHRGLMAGIAAVFVVLLGGIAVTTWMAVRASRAEAEARAVNDFLQNDVLAQAGASTQAGPGAKPDPDLKVRTALDRAAGHISSSFGKQPLVEASIRQTIGNAYIELGLFPEADKQLERAMDLRRRLLGEDHLETLSIVNDLEMLYRNQGKYVQAEPLASKVLTIRQRRLGKEHPETLEAMNNLGLLYRSEGKSAQAEQILTKVLEIRRRISGEASSDTLYAMNNLGVVYQIEGKYTQAETVLSEALEIRRRISGQEHPDTSIVIDNLGTVYYRQQKYQQAESLWAKNLEIRRRVLGDEHPDTLDSMQNLGAVYRAEGRFAQAEPLLTTAMEAKRRVLGSEHPFTLTSMLSLAMLYRYEREYFKAEPLMVEAVKTQSRVLGQDHPDRLAGMNRLAALYTDEGKYSEAETLFADALKSQRRVLGEDHLETLSSRDGLGRVQFREHKYVEAESTLRDTLKEYEKLAPESWERYNCQSMLGGSLEGQNKYADAESLLISGYEGLMQRKATVPLHDRGVLSESGERIVQLYQMWEKPDKLAEWRRRIQAK
ncbi:MAG TPA: serine/threonine-protein kinase [Candidatus Limnocylindrales bacterium]|nr:serine/threonine-protein kinase [Candidatus Limnocylindrales bacterium]